MLRKTGVVATALLCLLCCGCSSWTSISKSEAPTLIEAGDTVRVVDAAGQQHELEVREVTAAGRIVGEGQSFAIAEISSIRLREADATSSGLIFGGALLAALIVITAALAVGFATNAFG